MIKASIDLNRKLTGFVLLILFLFDACTNYHNQVHIDEVKKIVVPCDGGYINEIDVDGPGLNVSYYGVDTLYFNNPTKASQIKVGYDHIDNNFILKLEPNSHYIIMSRSPDHDQSPWQKNLMTDGNGEIVHDENNPKCY